MGTGSGQRRAQALCRQVADVLHDRTVVNRASGYLVEQYDLSQKQAEGFLQHKAHESGHSAADVAREVLDGANEEP